MSDGYKAYKADKNKKQIAWAAASSFVGLGHVKKAGKVLSAVKRSRAGKQGRHREMAKDPKLASHLRGHLKSEINRIKRKKTKGRNNIRVPFGYDMAHSYGKENKKVSIIGIQI